MPGRTPRPRRLLVVANPRAGGGRGAEGLLGPVARLREAGHRVELVWPARSAELPRLVADLAPRFDRVVVCGGDGTVSRVAGGLVQSGAATPLVVVPSGTANDFARSVGADVDVETALLLAASGAPAAVDVGIANGRPFVNAITGGTGADVSQRVSRRQKRWLGRFAYALGALLHPATLRPVNLRLTGEQGAFQGRVVSFAIANGRSTGGGTQVAPGARLNDGLLDAVIVPERPLAELAGAMRALRAGEPHPALVRLRSAWFRLEADRPLALTRDGEAFRAASLDVRLLPGALRVVVHGAAEALQVPSPPADHARDALWSVTGYSAAHG